ncbi:NAD-dependent deacylase [Sphingosinicella rhizophila]|uniref:NAD-dependent protein deacylase n=1 Tax=Sphingosinicella rhizophila TaxID=3050082 RepID=A0ABU3QBK3_9SPHN|nr:NAD-dependent deacylase [Sphingosinicella sp. GR2756]MDT9600764.1 NAD-dependent deacylase [Sphingosinicella sp. GR2756]
MKDIRNIVILTGAGISAESGLATFRGPEGLWEGHRVEDVATPEAFVRDPALVQKFYDERRANLRLVEPNGAHRALARLDSEWPGDLLIVTQNVDDLHERAGAKRVLHMHGELKSAWCLACDGRIPWVGTLSEGQACTDCGVAGRLRPDIVWFGEIPYGMDRIDRALMRADLFVSIGTSGAVYPAAGLVQTARYAGARTLEMNLEPSLGSHFFHESRTGPAGALVPDWVEEVLAG